MVITGSGAFGSILLPRLHGNAIDVSCRYSSIAQKEGENQGLAFSCQVISPTISARGFSWGVQPGQTSRHLVASVSQNCTSSVSTSVMLGTCQPCQVSPIFVAMR